MLVEQGAHADQGGIDQQIEPDREEIDARFIHEHLPKFVCGSQL